MSIVLIILVIFIILVIILISFLIYISSHQEEEDEPIVDVKVKTPLPTVIKEDEPIVDTKVETRIPVSDKFPISVTVNGFRYNIMPLAERQIQYRGLLDPPSDIEDPNEWRAGFEEYGGGLITEFTALGGPAFCREVCKDFESCRAWTFEIPTTICRLNRHGAEGIRKNLNFISGSFPHKVIFNESKAKYIAEARRVDIPQQCADICSAVPDCIKWTHNNKYCALHIK